MSRLALTALATLALQPLCWAQQTAALNSASLPGATAPAPKAEPAAASDAMAPTWETQKGARTYLLGIPAPRGQIVDRNGDALAQTRVSYNLAVAFPTPLKMSDHQVGLFVQEQVISAQIMLGRPVSASSDQAAKHYKNRGVLPFVIAQDLKPNEIEAVKKANPQSLVLQPTYQRYYPNGSMAGHVVGYAGRTGRTPDGVLQNNDLLWPGAEGREGLEQAFNDQLQGKPGTAQYFLRPERQERQRANLHPAAAGLQRGHHAGRKHPAAQRAVAGQGL